MKSPAHVYALFAAIAASGFAGGGAQAQDTPATGYYLIRQYSTTTNLTTLKGLAGAPYTVSLSMLLKADGTYEVYWYPSKEFRSRGTYTFNPADNTFRWHSGLHYDMGRRGTYAQADGICDACIQFGPTTFAVPVK